jgi:hypothetical protein
VLGVNEPRVREESHLKDMRAAIRGDFERLAKRRGTQELMQEPAGDVEPEPPTEVQLADVALEPETELTQKPKPEPEREPEPEPEPAAVSAPPESELQEERRRAPAPPPEPVPLPEAQADDVSAEPEVEEPPRRGFWARLLGL